MTIAEFRTKVETRIKDAANRLADPDLDAAIASAVEEYSGDRPREVVVTKAGAGVFDYAVSQLGVAQAGATPSTQWTDGTSQLLELVYPFDAAAQGFEPLSEDDFELLRLPPSGALTIRFLAAVPSATEQFLVRFTGPHTVDADLSTVPAGDVEAFSDLAAHYAFLKLQALYTQHAKPTIAADVADHGGVPEDYSALADSYRARYDAHVGKATTGRGGAAVATVPAAGARVELDRAFGDHVKTDYFFHGRRRF